MEIGVERSGGREPGRTTWKALCADDEPGIREVIADLLREEGFAVTTAEDGRQALKVFAAESPDVVVLDLKMPGFDGLEVLKRVKAAAPHVPVILVTGYGDIQTAVNAMRLGAHDFVAKPFLAEDFIDTVLRALDRRTVATAPGGDPARTASLTEQMGPSSAIRTVVEQVRQVACSSFTVVISGETGTGKELVARAIHQESARRTRPLVAVDCGAIPDTLIESELFGYERGAFTGADRRKEGYFRLADGGTLFLDEVANLPLPTQAKLLRALQEKAIQPLGAVAPVPVDVRIIAASNASLEDEVRAGRFRQDLYYRLIEFTIALPPLRARRDDIPHLSRRFLHEACLELDRPGRTLTDDAIQVLLRHDWPGNVRQLRNVVRQAVLVGPPLVRAEHLGISTTLSDVMVEVRDVMVATTSLKSIAEAAVTVAEQKAIHHALESARGNKSEAARSLGTDYKTLHFKMKRYGIRSEQFLVS